VDHARLTSFLQVIDRLEAALGRKGRLLDIGCGRGELLQAARGRGWDATGFDVSESFARHARARSGAEVLTGRLEDHALDRESFDAVTMVSVLHNTYDPMQELRVVAGLLRRDGVMFLEVTNNGGLFYRVADVYHRLVRDGLTSHLSPTFPSYQIFGFTSGTLRALLERSGYRVTALEVAGGVSPTREAMTWRAALLRIGVISVGLVAQATGQGGVLLALAMRAPS
jgi:SAM-dependent methyltransferase